MVGDSGYLETALPLLKEFLGNSHLSIAFIPFASVDDYGEYAEKVKTGLKKLPHTINLVKPENAKEIIKNSDTIMVGGGNTFKLLHDIYHYGLMDIIQQKVNAGTPYIGWSAGSNITGTTICTTNDMPIIEPESFKSLGFFPFQINPHYHSQPTTGQHGETRDQRILEFIKINPTLPVVCLPEGTALQMAGKEIIFLGEKEGVLFSSGKNKIYRRIIKPGENLPAL